MRISSSTIWPRRASRSTAGSRARHEGARPHRPRRGSRAPGGAETARRDRRGRHVHHRPRAAREPGRRSGRRARRGRRVRALLAGACLRARAALVPILALPVLVPQLVAASRGASAALSGDAVGALSWAGLLFAFAVVYSVLGLTIVPAAIE